LISLILSQKDKQKSEEKTYSSLHAQKYVLGSIKCYPDFQMKLIFHYIYTFFVFIFFPPC